MDLARKAAITGLGTRYLKTQIEQAFDNYIFEHGLKNQDREIDWQKGDQGILLSVKYPICWMSGVRKDAKTDSSTFNGKPTIYLRIIDLPY